MALCNDWTQHLLQTRYEYNEISGIGCSTDARLDTASLGIRVLEASEPPHYAVMCRNAFDCTPKTRAYHEIILEGVVSISFCWLSDLCM
jgi:hypothetical protein